MIDNDDDTKKKVLAAGMQGLVTKPLKKDAVMALL